MYIEKLNKQEIDDMLSEYILHRKDLDGLVSFEEFLENNVDRCPICGELRIGFNWEFHCKECYNDPYYNVEESMSEHEFNYVFDNYNDLLIERGV